MQICADQGWVRAGLAVLVAGVLGGGVLVAAGGGEPRTVTADGVADASLAAAAEAPKLADPPKDEPQVGDRVEMGSDGGSVTVLALEDRVSAGRLFGAGEDQKYIAAEVKGCSGPNEKNITFQPSYFLLRLDDGTIRDSGTGAKKPELTGGTIPAGKCLSGWVTFVAPEGALPTGVIYDGSTRTTWTVPVPKDAKPTTTTTMRPGAATPTAEDSGDSEDSDSDTTTTTRAKASTTTTTAKPKPTSTTASTAKPTATTARSGATTTTKPNASTATTAKPSSSSASTSTTSPKKTTATTTPPKGPTTTTTGANVEADPADSDG